MNHTGNARKSHNRNLAPSRKPRPKKSESIPDQPEPVHVDIHEILGRLIMSTEINRAGTKIMVGIAGTDRTGVISYISHLAGKCEVNIEDSFLRRFDFDLAGTYLIIKGQPDNIQRLKDELKLGEREMIPGKQICPAGLFDLHIIGDDRIGMLAEISGLLTEHDINIVMMWIEVIPKEDPMIHQEAILAGRPIPQMAMIHLRIEVPREQLSSEIDRRLREIDPQWNVILEEYKPAPGPRRVGIPWMPHSN